jgi:transcriptional regulator with XRE-family HTH domain
VGVGSRIRGYLVENGIKQKYVAKMSGISESKLNLALNEKRHLKFEEYEVICWVLNVGVDEFLTPHKPVRKAKEVL